MIFRTKIENETYMIHPNQSKNPKMTVQNLSFRIFFHEQVKFLKSGNWFQFYSSLNKDTFFLLTWQMSLQRVTEWSIMEFQI